MPYAGLQPWSALRLRLKGFQRVADSMNVAMGAFSLWPGRSLRSENPHSTTPKNYVGRESFLREPTLFLRPRVSLRPYELSQPPYPRCVMIDWFGSRPQLIGGLLPTGDHLERLQAAPDPILSRPPGAAGRPRLASESMDGRRFLTSDGGSSKSLEA